MTMSTIACRSFACHEVACKSSRGGLGGGELVPGDSVMVVEMVASDCDGSDRATTESKIFSNNFDSMTVA